MKKYGRLFLFLIPVFFLVGASGSQEVQSQIEKAKIFRDTYPLVSQADLNCSFFLLEEFPKIKIIASDRDNEKTMFSDADTFFVDKGKDDGLQEDQVWVILEIGNKIKPVGLRPSIGTVAFKRGRARIVRTESNRSLARVEKACGRVRIGDFLIPFEEKEGWLGKDMGFKVQAKEGAPTGKFVYLQDELNQIGTGSWGIIDMGKDQGIQIGQQLTIFKTIQRNIPFDPIGNLVVIDVGSKTSTVKILSCKDAVGLDYPVQVK